MHWDFLNGELVYKGPTTSSLNAKQVIDGSIILPYRIG